MFYRNGRKSSRTRNCKQGSTELRLWQRRKMLWCDWGSDSRDMGTSQLLSPGSSTTERNTALNRKGETAENLNIRKGEYLSVAGPASTAQTGHTVHAGEDQAQCWGWNEGW